MDLIAKEVFTEVLKISSFDTTPIQLIKKAVDVLHNKPIDKVFKKEIVKAVIERIAYGRDGIRGTTDDRLSAHTTELLITLINSELLDTLVDGVVNKFKTSGFPNCFKRKCLW